MKDTSDQHEDHAKPDSGTPSQPVTHVEACKRSNQGPKFESRNDYALDIRIVHRGEDGGEWTLGDNTALIIVSWDTLLAVRTGDVLAMTDMS